MSLYINNRNIIKGGIMATKKSKSSNKSKKTESTKEKTAEKSVKKTEAVKTSSEKITTITSKQKSCLSGLRETTCFPLPYETHPGRPFFGVNL